MSEAVRGQQQFGNASVTNGSQSFQGIAHGALSMNSTHNHYAPPRPDTPLKPTVLIPFSRDKDFVNRDDILDCVHELSATQASRIALVGLGGVGKSQIAIEYAFQIRDRSPDTWVFWVHASNMSRYQQSFRGIADYLKLAGREDPQANIFQLLYNWLLSEKSGKWVLIIDNVDDASFLVESPADIRDGQANNPGSHGGKPLEQYLPHCSHGSILITSRSKDTALQLVELDSIVTVNPMSQSEAVSLANNKLKSLPKKEDIESIRSLTETLEYMPLAIVQATAYILRREPRCSIGQYLERFETSDGKKAGLLDNTGKEEKARWLRRDYEAKNSIIITWQISFDHIRKIRPSASDLLSLMSFCDRQGIPDSLIQPYIPEHDCDQHQQHAAIDSNHPSVDGESTDEATGSEFSVDDQFQEDVSTLRDYSFITITDNGSMFEMHRLVQLATRRWLETKGQQERWNHEFLYRLAVQFPPGEYENWEQCRVLLPHAKSAAAQRPKAEASLIEWASVLHKAAWYLRYLGELQAAEKMAEDGMEVRIRIRGTNHEDTINSMHRLVVIYNLQGRWEAAEKLGVEVMEASKQKFGMEDECTLDCMAALVSTYVLKGQWEMAEQLGIQVLESRKRILGEDHMSTVTSMNDLVKIWLEQGRWDAAEEPQLQVLEISKRKLGEDHPNTLVTMGNLASIWGGQGRLEAAEELQLQVLETHKRILGEDHPETLASMNNLAVTWRQQGRWHVAEILGKEVFEARKQKLGIDHPDTLLGMNNLSHMFARQGRYSEALELMRPCMPMAKKVFGPQHRWYLVFERNLEYYEGYRKVNASG
ncbi:P-loop containing nucleoside triphosphate hydrolase protein [Astrocystis sublimbata]|nr:P-loop containing nucleoside triphosphate hydrolase protein [Astrocystis sublimbata]